MDNSMHTPNPGASDGIGVSHVLSMVSTFTTRTVGYLDCHPLIEAVTPYSRWYCTCGTVGGKSSTETAAVADHARHAKQEGQ